MPHHKKPIIFVSGTVLLVDGRIPTAKEKKEMNEVALKAVARAMEYRKQERLKGKRPPLGSKR